MLNRLLSSLLFFLSLNASSLVYAMPSHPVLTPLDVAALPAYLQYELSDTACTTDCVDSISSFSVADTAFMNAFTLERDGDLHWLLNYSLHASSGRVLDSLPQDSDTWDQSVFPVMGNLWLEVPVIPDQLATNLIRVYSDRTSPDLYGGNSLRGVFSTDYADLITGSLYGGHQGYDGVDTGETFGDILINEYLMLPCIECPIAHSINLVGLGFDGTAFQVNQNDSRSTVFTSYTASADFGNGEYVINDQFNVQAAVPVPAAIWLFVSGILSLYGLGRSRRTSICRERVG